MDESRLDQFIDFCFNLRDKLWAKASLSLLNWSIPLVDCEMMDCTFGSRPNISLYDQAKMSQYSVSKLMYSPSSSPERDALMKYGRDSSMLQRFTSLSSSTMDWPPSSSVSGASSTSSNISFFDSSMMVMWWHEVSPSAYFELLSLGLVKMTSRLFTFNKPLLESRVTKIFLFIREGTVLWIFPSPFVSWGSSSFEWFSASSCLMRRQIDREI